MLVEVYWNDYEHHIQRCNSVGQHQYGEPADGDTDSGPYEVWCTENGKDSVAWSFFLSGNGWRRECAYVLWDSDRVRKMGRFRRDPWPEQPVRTGD